MQWPTSKKKHWSLWKNACISIFDLQRFIYIISRISLHRFFLSLSVFISSFLPRVGKSQAKKNMQQTRVNRRIKLFHLLYIFLSFLFVSFIRTPHKAPDKDVVLLLSATTILCEWRRELETEIIALRLSHSKRAHCTLSQSYFIFTCHDTKNYIYERYNLI